MNLKTAKEESLKKWYAIQQEFAHIDNQIGMACGFCELANTKRTQDNPGKCDNCIPDIKTKCNTMLDFFQEQTQENDEMIDSIMQLIEAQ